MAKHLSPSHSHLSMKARDPFKVFFTVLRVHFEHKIENIKTDQNFSEYSMSRLYDSLHLFRILDVFKPLKALSHL